MPTTDVDNTGNPKDTINDTTSVNDNSQDPNQIENGNTMNEIENDNTETKQETALETTGPVEIDDPTGVVETTDSDLKLETTQYTDEPSTDPSETTVQEDDLSAENTDEANEESDNGYFVDYHNDDDIFYNEPYEVLDNTTPKSSTTDPINEILRQKRLKRIIITLLIIVISLAFALGAFAVLKNANKTKASPQSTTTTTTPTIDPEAVNKPLLQIYKDAPTVNPGEVAITITESTLTTTDGNILTINGQEITPSTADCKVTQPTDFCLTARMTTADDSYEIYYLKDAAHSRIFENPITFEKTELENSEAAGYLALQMGPKTVPALVTINKNSSGWMIVNNTQTDYDNLQTLSKTIELK
jgi:hypothetical protein